MCEPIPSPNAQPKQVFLSEAQTKREEDLLLSLANLSACLISEVIRHIYGPNMGEVVLLYLKAWVFQQRSFHSFFSEMEGTTGRMSLRQYTVCSASEKGVQELFKTFNSMNGKGLKGPSSSFSEMKRPSGELSLTLEAVLPRVEGAGMVRNLYTSPTISNRKTGQTRAKCCWDNSDYNDKLQGTSGHWRLFKVISTRPLSTACFTPQS